VKGSGRRRRLVWSLIPALLLLAGCGVAGSPSYGVQKSEDGTLSGVVVTLRVLDRKEAIAAYQPALVVFRDAGFVRWISLKSNVRELVIRDAFNGSQAADPQGDTFAITVDENGTADYDCRFGYAAASPLLITNYRQSQS